MGYAGNKFSHYPLIFAEKSSTIMTKLFTKSVFKVALSCPSKLYYLRNSDVYANANDGDEFLAALAQGGFQVGELAKYYCHVKKENDLKRLEGYDVPVQETAKRFEEKDTIIAEAAFQWKDLFVRVDILEKSGNEIKLIEVKSKSWDPGKDLFIKKDRKGKEINTINSDIREYVYDIAFQKYVVTNALKEQYPGTDYHVTAFLMLVDKSQRIDIDGINQLFKIEKDEQGRTSARMVPGAEEKLAQSQVQILTPFDVDEACNRIIAGTTTEQKSDPSSGVKGYMGGLAFVDFIEKASRCYCHNLPFSSLPELGGKCFKCQFKAAEGSSLKDGCKECWSNYVSSEEMKKPMMQSLNGFALQGKPGKWVAEGKYFLEDITVDMMKRDTGNGSKGLDHLQRKWLQIALATSNTALQHEFGESLNDGTYLDKEGLRQEMKTWVPPLHMIDFETTAVALPYYKDMKPMEQVAFQFSHHIISISENGDYSIEHKGQYLNKDVYAFPNFEFVRELKRQLSQDNGTIFRYSHHENTILRAIADQLDASLEPDKQELIDFIRDITHNNSKEHGELYTGKRDMVDLCEIVKSYFYQYEEMKGSNSIKQVLPAVLNSSAFLQEKYGAPQDGSAPVYGTVIPSLNFSPENPMIWLQKLEDGRIDSPYHQLEPVASLLNLTKEEEAYLSQQEEEEGADDFSVANGGAALTAYNKLMFCQGESMSEALRTALLRYCELDTMAMVFIWEYFHDNVKMC